jgi:hypothetical protein
MWPCCRICSTILPRQLLSGISGSTRICGIRQWITLKFEVIKLGNFSDEEMRVYGPLAILGFIGLVVLMIYSLLLEAGVVK